VSEGIPRRDVVTADDLPAVPLLVGLRLHLHRNPELR
jgi:hypothetical protein